MNTIKNPTTQTGEHTAQRGRRLALGLGAALGAILRPAFRRRLAAVGAATTLATSSLLTPQPAAAASVYTVSVIFNYVQFGDVDDGCYGYPACQYTDYTMEIYGSVAAYTSAGAASAGGLPNRNFGTWGKDPCERWWDSASGGTCAKVITAQSSIGFATTPNYFSDVLLCKGSNSSTCNTAYSQNNNQIITLQVHPGETITVAVAMQDYDWGSANDNVCTGNKKFGPYTDAQLQARAYPGYSEISMPNNGNAACIVSFNIS